MGNGLADATTWNIQDGRISSDVGPPSQVGAQPIAQDRSWAMTFDPGVDRQSIAQALQAPTNLASKAATAP